MPTPLPRHWVLGSRPLPALDLPLAQTSALLSHLGQGAGDAVAENLLRLVGAHAPLAQCTVFAFQPGRKPVVVAVGDRSRTQELPHIAEAYVNRFYRLDGLAAVMQAEWAAAQKAELEAPRILLHRQTGADIAHAEYRKICYELPQVAERLAVLALYEGRRWMSVHLYRGTEHGPFDEAGIQVVEAFAPLIVQAVRLHHTGLAVHQDLGGLLLARAVRRWPQLTQRDSDVVMALMDGLDTAALAVRLGLTVSSAQTYCQRVYRKLGLAGQRELVAALLESSG
jgi:DNA-binding CsgD family transcriptional regulator